MAVDPEPVSAVLRDLDDVAERVRDRVTAITGPSLVGWGLAWLIGYPAAQLSDGMTRIALVALAGAVGLGLSWLPRRYAVRTGWLRRMHLGWLTVLVASPFMVATLTPASMPTIALFLGSLWSLAMTLYGVATVDVWYGVAAFVGVLAAGTATSQPWLGELVWFGILAGVPLLGLGLVRTVVSRG